MNVFGGLFRKTLKPVAVALPAEASNVRPLAPVAANIPIGTAATQQFTPELRNTADYPEILAYFSGYPLRSVMSDHSRATLFTLIRMLHPKVVAEVGTMYAGTTEVMARAMGERRGHRLYDGSAWR